MKIGEIELGKSYYGYACIDNGAFRLLRYLITEKSTWSFKARRFMVSEYGEAELTSWAGYPDNLYKTIEGAIAGLKANVEKLKEDLEKKTQHMVNGINIAACCTTCSHLMPETQFCTEFKDYVCYPDTQLCKEGAYSCDPAMINSEVNRIQRSEK